MKSIITSYEQTVDLGLDPEDHDVMVEACGGASSTLYLKSDEARLLARKLLKLADRRDAALEAQA